MKKTYKSVYYEDVSSGFALLSGKKPALTPLGNPLILPNPELATAVAQEWQLLPLPPGEADFVSEAKLSLRNPVRDRTACPSPNPLPKGEGFSLTQIACVAIDLVAEKRELVCEEILAHGDTDLVCYRAGNIPVLQQRQEELLSPIIAWAEQQFAIELAVTDGLMPVAQPPENALKLHAVLSEYDDWQLAAIALVTKPLGSLILALALLEHRINAEDAFALSHLEEAYETGQWGEDAEKQARMQKIREEILAVERFLTLLCPPK